MAKLKLSAEPTFKSIVNIPVPGAGSVPVQFTFKHRTRKEAAEWLQNRKPDDVDVIMDCVVAWELDDELNADNVDRMLQSYHGAGFAILSSYLDELRGARAKN